MEELSAKEVTLNYLKSIKRDVENAYNKCRKDTYEGVKLGKDLSTLINAITIVEESEGE